MELFKEELQKRAKSALFNPDEITQEAIDVASSETFEECSGKDVKSWAKMDFAMIRLKVYLKIGLSEEDIVLLKAAKREIDNSPKSGETKNKDDGFYYEVV